MLNLILRIRRTWTRSLWRRWTKGLGKIKQTFEGPVMSKSRYVMPTDFWRYLDYSKNKGSPLIICCLKVSHVMQIMVAFVSLGSKYLFLICELQRTTIYGNTNGVKVWKVISKARFLSSQLCFHVGGRSKIILNTAKVNEKKMYTKKRRYELTIIDIHKRTHSFSAINKKSYLHYVFQSMVFIAFVSMA